MKEFILFAGMVVIAFLFNIFRYDQLAQILVALLGCMYYISWGIIHHALEERIKKAIILEYILIGGVAFLLILLVLAV